MTTINLKKHLIQRISEIKNPTFLEVIKTVLDTKSTVLKLTPEQGKEIQKSQEQVSQGLFISQSELDEEFEKWESEKQIGLTWPKSNF